MERFPRTFGHPHTTCSLLLISVLAHPAGGAALGNTIRRLPLLFPFATTDGAGRIAPRPMRRGGVARPVVGRWYRRQSRNASIV